MSLCPKVCDDEIKKHVHIEYLRVIRPCKNGREGHGCCTIATSHCTIRVLLARAPDTGCGINGQVSKESTQKQIRTEGDNPEINEIRRKETEAGHTMSPYHGALSETECVSDLASDIVHSGTSARSTRGERGF